MERGILSLQGTLRNDDFARIFGKQEASERETRELATEYYKPPPERSSSNTNNAGEDGEDKNTGNSNNSISKEQLSDDGPAKVNQSRTTTHTTKNNASS